MCAWLSVMADQLCGDQVAELRRRREEGASALAREFSVGRQTVYAVWAGVGAYSKATLV